MTSFLTKSTPTTLAWTNRGPKVALKGIVTRLEKSGMKNNKNIRYCFPGNGAYRTIFIVETRKLLFATFAVQNYYAITCKLWSHLYRLKLTHRQNSFMVFTLNLCLSDKISRGQVTWLLVAVQWMRHSWQSSRFLPKESEVQTMGTFYWHKWHSFNKDEIEWNIYLDQRLL